MTRISLGGIVVSWLHQLHSGPSSSSSPPRRIQYKSYDVVVGRRIENAANSLPENIGRTVQHVGTCVGTTQDGSRIGERVPLRLGETVSGWKTFYREFGEVNRLGGSWLGVRKQQDEG